MSRRKKKRGNSPFELGSTYGDWLIQPEAPKRKKRRRISRKEIGFNPLDPFSIFGLNIFSTLFGWSDRDKLERQTQKEKALIAARQRELGSAWQRAMVEFFPDGDADTFPSSPGSLSYKRLEHLAEHIYARLGYQAEHVGGAGDGGVDVRLEKFGEIEFVQCKQYQGPVQPETIRALYGAMGRKAQKAYLWAPNGFTEAAKAEARRFSRIELVDANGILELVEKAYPPQTPQPAEISEPVIASTNDEPPRRFFGMTGGQIFSLILLLLLICVILEFILSYVLAQR